MQDFVISRTMITRTSTIKGTVVIDNLGSVFDANHVPRGSYPTPILGRLLFKIADLNHKTRYPRKG